MFSDDDQAVCCGEGNFIVNLAGMKAAPTPLALHPSSLLSFFFLFIYMPLHHKPVQRASGSSWACGHNTDRVPHQSSFYSAHREERRAKREEEEERKSGTNSVSHTYRKSVFAHGKNKVQLTSVVLRWESINLCNCFTHTDSLSLAPTLILFTASQALGGHFSIVSFYFISVASFLNRPSEWNCDDRI